MAIVIPTVGLAAITALLAASTNNYVGWGTGATAAAAGDTALETAAAEARVAGTQTQETTTVTDDTYQVVATLTSASSQTIREVGILSASTAGTLLLHANHADTALANGEAIAYTLKIVAANA